MKKLVTLECTRRTVLQGVGAAAAVAILPACGRAGSDLPTATDSQCTGGTCIDLTVAANAPLTMIGGAMLIDTSTDTIMVIRASDTQVLALSAICTHDSCSMNFDATHSQITCPCHGSVFDEQGAVVKGPARRPIKVYQASLTNNTITVAT
jgi:Rieske Fe-S protein